MLRRTTRHRGATAVTLACVVAACADESRHPTAAPAEPIAPDAARASLSALGAAASVTVPVQVPTTMRTAPFDVPRSLTVPPSFSVRVYARVAGARFIAVAPNGDLLVSNPGAGAVYVAKPNAAGDGVVSTWVSGLRNPHDVVFHTIGGVTYVYVAESDKIARYVYNANGTPGARQVLVTGLPDNSSGALQGRYGHQLKNVALHGSSMYVSIASPSNADPADLARTPKGGAIYLYPATGGAGRLFAQGLRNAEGLAIAPGTTTLWVVVNQRDNVAYPFHRDITGDGVDDYGRVLPSYVDDHPPEALTSVRDGGHYGWPLCNPTADTPNGLNDMPFDRDVQTNATGAALDCNAADRVRKGIQAHSAPLGLTFWVGTNAPTSYAGGAVVPLHGSWNRTTPSGYKVVYFPWSGGLPGAQVDLVTGWTTGGRWGRPVDAAVAPDGGLYLSDDYSGTIYKLTYTAPSPPPGAPVRLVSGAGYGCLSTYGGTATQHSSLSVVACSTSAGQQWTPPAVGSTGRVSSFNGAICVAAYGAAANTVVGTDPCSGSAAQHWTRTSAGELRTPGGLCATATGTGTSAVWLRACTGATNQRWSAG
jgi:glucose/arabinose dehydrogenase